MDTTHEIIKRQFNEQARNFSDWSITKNREYQKAYFDFCKITPTDKLLDVACGTGDYTIFAAAQIAHAQGIDISKGMIEIAQQQAEEKNISNIDFLCHPVENIPFEDDSFSIVICRSAFHHFHAYDRIFHEMVRCCRKGGRISVQDIVAYPDEKIDRFFESFEKAVDVSHHQTATKTYIESLFTEREIPVRDTFSIEIELNAQEYLGHARQSEESKKTIGVLLERGLNDPDISKYFIIKEKDLFFKREVFLILGQKSL
jgi:ubiquinone/menaquinone biosynthesis C-methylase UbiE